MRYYDLLAIYPNIEELFSSVSDLTHDELVGPELAKGFAQRWIRQYIAEIHQEAVTEKIEKFIRAISKY